MLELNFWFFVLMANFLFLIFMLNLILFKPLLKTFKEREDTVRGSMQAAKEMTEKKDSALLEMKRDLSEARLKAKAVFEALRAQGLDLQKSAVSAAAEEAGKLTGKARETLKQEAEKARRSLRADVEKFSSEIVRKLIAS